MNFGPWREKAIESDRDVTRQISTRFPSNNLQCNTDQRKDKTAIAYF